MTDLSRGHPISRPQAMNQDDIDALNRRFDREREMRGMGSGNQFNGSTKYVNAMLTLLSGLMLAGIIGGIAMYANVAALTQSVKATNDKVDLIIAGKFK